MKKSKFWIFTLVFICLLGHAESAYAYLDPGSGSYLFQLIVAGLLTMSFALKAFWSRIRTFLKTFFSKYPKK